MHKKRLAEADIIRVYAIIFIVVWHCFCCPICGWPTGVDDKAASKLAQWIAVFFIPEANRPLFTCLSGYLFAHALSSAKDNSLSPRKIIYKKFLRLVVPFAILGTLANLSVPDRPMSLIMWGEGSSLWFCMMLFWVIVMRICVQNLPKYLSFLHILLCIFSCALTLKISQYYYPKYLMGIPVGFMGISRAFFFYIFFSLGEFIYTKRQRLASISPITLSSLVFSYLLACVAARLNLWHSAYWCTKSAVFIQPFVLFTLAYKLANTVFFQRATIRKSIQEFCRCSFGIYVLHEQISWDCYHVPYLVHIFRLHPVSYAVCFSIVMLALCYGTTYLILKTKSGRFLFS